MGAEGTISVLRVYPSMGEIKLDIPEQWSILRVKLLVVGIENPLVDYFLNKRYNTKYPLWL